MWYRHYWSSFFTALAGAWNNQLFCLPSLCLPEGILKVFIIRSPIVLYNVNDADGIRKQTVYAPGGLGQGALAYPQAWLTPGQLKFVWTCNFSLSR